MNDWFVYLVRCKDGTLYCGTTKDITRRMEQHNTGVGAKYTRGRGPVVLIAYISGLTQSLACKLEKLIKAQMKHRKLTFMEDLNLEGGQELKVFSE